MIASFGAWTKRCSQWEHEKTQSDRLYAPAATWKKRCWDKTAAYMIDIQSVSDGISQRVKNDQNYTSFVLVDPEHSHWGLLS